MRLPKRGSVRSYENLNSKLQMPKNRLTPKAMIHASPDFVAVATDDISKGEEITAVFMDDGKQISVQSKEDIPLGHKIALKSIKKDEKLVEYGNIIGVATSNIAAGEHVHTHNLKSLRW